MVKRAPVRTVAIVVLVGLLGFGGTSAILAQSQNCALTLQGQEYHISGGSGGIVLNAPPGPVVAFEEVAGYLGDVLASTIDLLPVNSGESVALLVVDDFNGKKPEEFLPDTTSLAGAQISHGDMVYQHINRTIWTLVNMGIISGELVLDNPGVETHWALGASGSVPSIDLYVVPVLASGQTPPDPMNPTLGYDTKTIADNISAKISDYSAAAGLNVQRFVVNMSFTVLPCNIVEAFLGYHVSGSPLSFEAFLLQEYLRGSTNLSNFQQWFVDWFREESAIVKSTSDRIITNVGEELLLGCGRRGVFVAAAGNFGGTFDFPLFPGRWDEVVSVSGYEGSLQPQPAPWMDSNIGEVMMPAAWYQYVAPDGTQTEAYYAGTSFAAPVMSIFTALWLSQPHPIAYPFHESPPPFASVPFMAITDVPSFPDIFHLDTGTSSC